MSLKGVFLPLGYSCNNNCIHCFLPFVDNPTNMTTEQAKESISQLLEYGIDRISLSGGEPTLRKDIFEIIEFCRSSGIENIQLQTNARMLSYEPFCRKLFASGITEMAVSLHAHTPEIHDSITRSKGSFSQTILGVNNLMKVAPGFVPEEKIFANLVISKYNVGHLPEIVEFFSELKFPLVEIEYPRIMGNALRFKTDIPTRKDAAPKVTEAVETAKKLGIGVFIDDFPVCLSDGFYGYNAYTRPGNDQIELDFSVGKIRDTEKTGKMWGPKCQSCAARGKCPGEWPDNAENFGWEDFRSISKNEMESILKKVDEQWRKG